MSEAIRLTKEYLEAIQCRPEDADYRAQFKERLEIEQARLDATEERRRTDEAEERRRADEERRRADEERRRADEVEERRRADEAEERRRADEAEERRLERAHEIAMLQQQSAATQAQHSNVTPPNVPPPRVMIDILPFAPASERADRFIRRFETIAQRENVPEDRYAEQLMKALPPSEVAPLLSLPIEDQFVYKTLKEVFLRRHKVTETQLRDDFRQARPTKDDSASTFARTLGRAFDYWVEATEMEKEYENLRDRIIADQITDILPNYLLILLREKHAHTVDDVVSHLDAYFEARPSHGLHSACQTAAKQGGLQKPNNQARQGASQKSHIPSSTAPPSRSAATPGPNPSGTPKTRTSSQNTPAAGAPKPAPAPASRASPSTGALSGSNGRATNTTSPRGCSYHGPNATHQSSQCYVLHPEKRPAASSSNERDSSNWRQMPRQITPPRTANVALTGSTEDQGPALALTTLAIPPAICATAEARPQSEVQTCEGILNDRPVTVLLDSGSDSIFVARRLVDPASFTGGTMSVRTAMALHHGCPIAKATFSCPYYPATGCAILVVVLEDPPYDVLLGQVNGSINFNETPPEFPAYNTAPDEDEDTPSELVTPREVTTSAVVTRGQKKSAEARANAPSAAPIGPLSPLLNLNRRKLQLLQEGCETLSKLRQRAFKRTESAIHKDGVETYHLVDGLLYRQELSNGCSTRQVVVPKCLRNDLLKVAHENPFSGHFSTVKTEARVRRDFYWPRLTESVRDHCRTCHQCQVGNLRRTPRAPLGMPAIPTEPFAHVCVDLVGPLSPSSSEGHRYVLTLVDKATRFPDAVALRHIDSGTVSQALLGMFSHVGFPTTLTSDNGTQFTSEMFEEFLKGLGTHHQLTPPYHAQSNGLVERFNGTLKQILKKLCAERPKDWHLHLPAVLFAYRDAPHAATGFSPFELVMGHRVRGPLTAVKEAMIAIPSSDDVPPDEESARAISQRVLDLKDHLQETCALARTRLNTAQEKHKVLFDRKARARTLQVDDQVLIFLPTKPSKLLMTWQGPGVVLERLGLNTYKVKYGERVRNYHINHLRKYLSRETSTTSPPEDEETVDDPTATTSTPGACKVIDEVSEAYAAVAIAIDSPEDMDTRDPCVPSDVASPDEASAINYGPDLDVTQKAALENLVATFSDVFSATPGRTETLKHQITINSKEPLRLQHSYPLPLALEPTLRQELDAWLEAGVVEPSQSPYCSPLLAVRKKDGSHRFCLDCRQLNAQTVFDGEPISDPHQIFASISKARFFSKLDLTSGYWQVPMAEQSKAYTAFRTRFGLFQFTVMPFGLVNAPATFSRLMREVTKGLPHTHCYLDDLLVATETWDEHLKALTALLEALQRHGLKAKPTKCELGFAELTYLGHNVGAGRYNPLPDRVKAISEMPLPKTKKQIRSFLGSVGYYDQFVPHYAALRAPLDQLLRKTEPDIVQWNPSTIQAFEVLRQVLTKEPILQLPDSDLPFTLQTDASDIGLGAVLLQPCQVDPRKLAPVAYASRTLKGAERNYSTIEKEGLAVFWALQKFHVYLYGREFTLRTDHKPLLYLGQADRLNPRLKRWALLIGLYRFRPEHIPGPENCIPDLLSRPNE